MITEFTLRPKASNRRALYLAIAFLVGAAAFMVLYFALPVYKGVVGVVAIALLAAAILVYTKYISPSFYYDITVVDGLPLFVVRQLIGKRYTTLCRIELRTIIKIEKQEKTERRAHQTPVGYVRYSYAPTLMPEVTYLITSVSRYEKAEITIEANDEFASLLSRYAEEARALYAEAEENEEY